ncbi:MAG: ATP-dependent zinc metalloprotease FtsH [Lachnospiraceae bacterium]
MNDKNNKKDNGKLPKSSQTILLLAIAVMFTLFVMSAYSSMTNKDNQNISYTKLMELAQAGDVESVYVNNSSSRLEIKLTKEASKKIYQEEASKSGISESASSKLLDAANTKQIVYYAGIPADADFYNKMEQYKVDVSDSIPDTNSAILDFLLIYIVPILIFWFFLMFIMRRAGGGGVMGVGKSNAKMYIQKETGVTFADVAGEDEAKESLTEIVDFLHNPDRYVKIGAKLPKGALLVGPPGTGKTLLAKAVAGEAHVPFFSLSGSDFVEMFVGVGASRVRDLFKQAQNNAPCIIFIDEIDAIGKSRDGNIGGNDEREQTLNQLLSEMDGFDTSKGIFILAATNRPEVLDKALLRPGRFDRRIIVDRPDLKGRINILKVHSKDVAMDETVDLDAIALATSGAVGSDLANMINEAAINAVKHGRKAISQADLFESVEVVLVGKEKKDRILSQEERRIVSYHEVGHALVSALQKDAEPVQKITIVPRTMGALGYVMNVPEEEKYLNTEAEIRAMLVQFLAGRAAEEIVFNTVTTGAANDIEKATKIARAMVTQYGMSEEFGLMGLESIESQYLSGRTVLNCSDITASGVDEVVKRTLKESYAKAKELLLGHRRALDEIAAFLIEKESITGKEFMEIFHRIEAEERGELPVKEIIEKTAETAKEEAASETAEGAGAAETEETAAEEAVEGTAGNSMEFADGEATAEEVTEEKSETVKTEESMTSFQFTWEKDSSDQ